MILNQAYILGIFDDFIEELQVFKEFLEHLYEKKVHGKKSNTKNHGHKDRRGKGINARWVFQNGGWGLEKE